MKNLKRVLVVMLAVVLSVGAALSIGAATFTDTETHWAWTNGYIPYLVEKNVLNGYKQNDGTYKFKPDGEVTRAEFIKMLDETFGLTATTSISYSDVKSTDWFYVYFQKAAAQGYILNYGNSCNPNGKITREEAISLLVRYLDLNPENVASASTFSDYNEINAKYQTYVLEAIDAGLIDGYRQNDGTYKFKPYNTLTRAESLTILYRAAGCIFNKNAYARDEGAADTNNVITKGGITVAKQTLDGRTIVSEGAADGIVTFSDCVINDTLYIRGNAKVYLDKCVVKNIVVEGKGGISLLTGTTIENMELANKANIVVSAGTSIDDLTVDPSAAGASVNGKGEIGKITVKGNKFNSEIMPGEFDIVNNLTATFAGQEYTGNSEKDSIYTVEPYTAQDQYYSYIEMTSTVAGSAYYYYAKTGEVPTATKFDENYRTADYAGRIAVKADTAVSEKTGTTADLKKYPYVVILFQSGTTRYAPIVISNSSETSNGFTVAPAFDASKNIITFKSAHAGTVSYYYSKTGDALTPNAFGNGYKKAENALKGTINVNATSTSSITVNEAYKAQNGFIIIQLTGTSGNLYVPVVVSIGNNGFAIVPTVKTAGTISYTSAVTGTLYCYYAKESTIPSAAEFLTKWSAATYNDSKSTMMNRAETISYKPSVASAYPYMVFAVSDSTGIKLPVVVKLDYDSGFDIVPKMTKEREVFFRTSFAGTVQYYYTTSSLIPSVTEFNSIYNAIISDMKGERVAPRAGYDATINVPATIDTSKYYIVIMITDTNKNAYAPIVLPLKYNAADVSVTGFITTPYIRDGYLYATAVSDGVIRYYYDTMKRSVSPTEFYTAYNKASYRGEETCKAGEQISIKINESAHFTNQAIVVAFYNGSAYSEPVSMFAYENSGNADNTSGLTYTVSNNVVLIVPGYSGILYTKETDSTSDFPAGAADLSTMDAQVVEYGKSYIVNTEKKYVIAVLKTNAVTYSTVIIDMEKGGNYEKKEYDDRATSTSTAISVNINDEQNKIWKLSTSVNGYIGFTLVGDAEEIAYREVPASKGNLGTRGCTVGDLVEFTYGDIYSYAQGLSGYEHIYLYAQVFEIPLATYKSVRITLK